MRKALSILLIFLISLQSIYKAGLVAYFETNRDYIAAVLCINKSEPLKQCHGHCFLKKNLEKAGESSTEGTTATYKENISGKEFLEDDLMIIGGPDYREVSYSTFHPALLGVAVHLPLLKPPIG